MAIDWIGIDVGKFELNMCGPNGSEVIKNQVSSIKQWIKALLKIDANYRVVCEATGGYERPLVRLLRENQIDVIIEHPNKIRSFSKTKGYQAKTDVLDAAVIREYGQTMSPKVKPVYLSENQRNIRELLKRRDQLIDARIREKTRRDKEHIKTIKKSIKKHITYLDNDIKLLDSEIKKLTEQEESTRTLFELLCSIPGVGKVTALMLIAYLPELRELNAKQLAALVGVAPFNRDSGRWQGKRYIQGGRACVRKALYMAALAAIRCNQPLIEFYTRLRGKGKCAKVAITAVINKLISMIHSVVKRQAPWVEKIA